MRQTVLKAVTTTSSGVMNANYLENITFQFLCSGHASGNGVLTLLGSNDGVNYTALSFVDPTQANTNSQGLIRLTSLTLSSNTSAVGVIQNDTGKFEYLKWTVTVTTDGSYSVFVHADKKSS